MITTSTTNVQTILTFILLLKDLLVSKDRLNSQASRKRQRRGYRVEGREFTWGNWAPKSLKEALGKPTGIPGWNVPYPFVNQSIGVGHSGKLAWARARKLSEREREREREITETSWEPGPSANSTSVDCKNIRICPLGMKSNLGGTSQQSLHPHTDRMHSAPLHGMQGPSNSASLQAPLCLLRTT